MTGRAAKVPSNSKTVWELLRVRGLFKRHSVRDGASAIFRNLAPRTTGSDKPPTLTTATISAAPTAVPALAAATLVVTTTAPASAKPTSAPASAKPTTSPPSESRATSSAKKTAAPPSEPRATSSAKKTTTTAKGSRLPSVTRTDLVTTLPAPLLPDYDAKRAAKGKGDYRKRSSDRDDVIDVDRESKRALTRFASPPRRVSRSVFQDKTSPSSLFSTLVLSDDVVAPIDMKSSGEMMRQGLKVYL
ncbi:hypothetical protein AALP_AA2G044300 [Arabis alpina]|uniref:Uncharacterized protein n=1 Tax=Arabis alpina TaxID=50452 RepID=A0A087HFB0_ARAAL|nr:hypothetical protein AALP_AA2G044300 [Arabis alpina]